MEAQNNSSSSPPRSLGAVRTKNDAQVAYGVRFKCSLYGWKDNFKELAMAPVSCPNSFGVDGNRRNKRASKICHGAAISSFGLLAHVSCWGPLWTWLGGYARPNHHIISSLYHIRVRVLFSSSFWFWNFDWFIVTVATSPFTVIQGPRSYSTPLWRLVLLWSELEPHIDFLFIHSAILDCVFTLYCLCSSIRLQEKPSQRGQSSCARFITNKTAV